MDRGAWRATVHAVSEADTTSNLAHTCLLLRRQDCGPGSASKLVGDQVGKYRPYMDQKRPMGRKSVWFSRAS